MVVIKAFMWPNGDPSKEQFISAATLTCVGRLPEDDPSTGLAANTRLYRLTILKGESFGGPGLEALPTKARSPHHSDVWRKAHVGGHRPGRRGLWDVLGGALGSVLGGRLTDYRKLSAGDADRLSFTKQARLFGGRRG